jgi:hypothetical protein
MSFQTHQKTVSLERHKSGKDKRSLMAFFHHTIVERLKHLGPDDLAEELSGQFEGDMVMSPEEIAQLTGTGRNGRTGLIDQRFRWTDNIIPYQIREEDFSE